MDAPSYAILGFGRPRSLWFGSLLSWSNSGALPASVTKCVSAGEVRQRLSSLQVFSVLLIEDSLLHADPGLLDTARNASVPVVVVGSESHEGASAQLPFDFSPALLLSTLAAHAQIFSSAELDNVTALIDEVASWRGKLIAVCGPGGTGASTTAMAIAQGLGDKNLDGGSVLLADFTRNTELSMLHDLSMSRTSVEDVVELHRLRRPDSDEIRSNAIAMNDRGYYLLPGVLKPSSWASMSMMAIDNTFAGLRRSYLNVVADITGDFEGEDVAGSIDIEERNAFARLAVTDADLVVAVGRPGAKGVHSLARTIREMIVLGLEPQRILPVIVTASKSPAGRADITRALSALINEDNLMGPVFVKDESAIDDAIRDGVAFPTKYCTRLSSSVDAVLARLSGNREPAEAAPIRLGAIGDYEEAI